MGPETWDLPQNDMLSGTRKGLGTRDTLLLPVDKMTHYLPATLLGGNKHSQLPLCDFGGLLGKIYDWYLHQSPAPLKSYIHLASMIDLEHQHQHLHHI